MAEKVSRSALIRLPVIFNVDEQRLARAIMHAHGISSRLVVALAIYCTQPDVRRKVLRFGRCEKKRAPNLHTNLRRRALENDKRMGVCNRFAIVILVILFDRNESQCGSGGVGVAYGVPSSGYTSTDTH